VTDNLTEGAVAKLGVFYPSRAESVMHVLALRNNPAKLIPEWRETQLLSFAELLNTFALDLKRSYEEKRIVTLTWLVRSLYELSIWVRYCNRAEANARRFSDDSMRDFYGYCKGLQTILIKRGIDEKHITKLMENFSGFAKLKGVAPLADDYLRVSEAATALGEGREYAAQNKIYSKLAHPTSFALSVAFAHPGENSYLDIFLLDGVQYAIDALVGIRDFVVILYPEPSSLSLW
jgi:hypothetical protein